MKKALGNMAAAIKDQYFEQPYFTIQAQAAVVYARLDFLYAWDGTRAEKP